MSDTADAQLRRLARHRALPVTAVLEELVRRAERAGWEGVEPSGPLRKISVRLTIVPLSCSPDANGFRLRSTRPAS